MTEALETDKQRLKALVTHLKRYNREVEAWTINRIFTMEQSKAYTQWEDKMRMDPPRGDTDQYWRSIWKKEVSQNTSAQCLADLRGPQPSPRTSPSKHHNGGYLRKSLKKLESNDVNTKEMPFRRISTFQALYSGCKLQLSTGKNYPLIHVFSSLTIPLRT